MNTSETVTKDLILSGMGKGQPRKQTEGDKRDITIMKQAGRYTGSRVLTALQPGKSLETKGMSRFEEFALSKTFK